MERRHFPGSPRIEGPCALSSRSETERTPVAVALQYELGSPEPPRVVASGRGAIAERILELAKAHGIAIRENADLAEMLDA
ncbi:MAG: EscU/YscU/HrcU family type III secretion system export apparatus switch protein, partial [Stellaceae bacterium]